MLKLDCYVDADFAGLWKFEPDNDPVCVKSRTGYVVFLGSCPIITCSKLQTEIALSTLESEYIALSLAMREILPLRELLKEVGDKLQLDFTKPTLVHSTIFEDNNGAIQLATSPKISPRTKHIGIKYHFFKSHIGLKEGKGIGIKKIGTTENIADLFTKGLPPDKFKTLREGLMGW